MLLALLGWCWRWLVERIRPINTRTLNAVDSMLLQEDP